MKMFVQAEAVSGEPAGVGMAVFIAMVAAGLCVRGGDRAADAFYSYASLSPESLELSHQSFILGVSPPR